MAVTDANGNLLQQQRYLPFGQVRQLQTLSPITQTDFGYTGQRALDAQKNQYTLGLMDYKARFYDPANEFAFRWEYRKTTDGERMVKAVEGIEGKRLIYKETISHASLL